MAAEPAATTGCDTSDMIMFHRNLRKLYADAAPLVRGVKPGDQTHATAVADHLEEISQTLHQHHHGEDLLLWDQLSARAPSCAMHVEQMKAQHAAMAVLLDELGPFIARWRTSAAEPDATAQLVAALDRVNTSLVTHLGREEETILPVAAKSMPQEEWNRLGEHGRASVPRNRQLASLGYILDSMTPEDAAAWMKANLPAPVRLLYRTVGKRRFEAEQRALRGSGIR